MDLSTEILKLTEHLSHRGPDYLSTYLFKNVALGNTRLSIVDHNKRSNQPLRLKGTVITFNGEIYNHKELRAELSEGWEFQTKSDTEVVLAAYSRWGYECVQHFEGMWAFAILHEESGEIFCSRDRFGERPFYYAQNDEKFAFSSEVLGLSKLLELEQINSKVVSIYLLFGVSDFSSETFIHNILELPPGHNLIINSKDSTYTILPYNSLSLRPTFRISNPDEIVSELHSLLNVTLAKLQDIDCKVGISLSAGSDSKLLSILARNDSLEEHRFLPMCLTAKSRDVRLDESTNAQSFAQSIGLEWIEVDTENLVQRTRSILEKYDQPVAGPSVLLQFLVMEKARELGIKVMLDGQGADEVFLGYYRYLTFSQSSEGARSGLLANLIRAIGRDGVRAGVVYNIYACFFTYYRFAHLVLMKRKLIIKMKSLDGKSIKEYLIKTRERRTTYSRHLNEIFGSQLRHLLRYADNSSMLHGVEMRLPYLNESIVNFALMHHTQLITDKREEQKWPIKFLLESLYQGNPNLPNTKLGFEVPRSYLKDFLPEMKAVFRKSDLAQTFLRNKKLAFIELPLLWRLYNLVVWADRNNLHLELSE